MPADVAAFDNPAVSKTIAALTAIRATTSRAGNRRSLFAHMDQLFGGGDEGRRGVSESAPMIAAQGLSVRLERLRLCNWKSFERAELVIPGTATERSTVVILGDNGYGKSSILEAFAFGLFGSRALTDIGFLMNGTVGRGERRRSYRALLERTLHRSARATEAGMCSVELEFSTAEGPIAVERKWYFDEARRLIEEDEELLVRTGRDRAPLKAPAGVPLQQWRQEEIERRIMPAGLAPFFVFDGEQVERWADRRMSDQVRSALDRILGLSDLAALAEDLKDYARDRERGGEDTFRTLSGLRDNVDAIERDMAGELAAIKQIDARVAADRAARDESLAQLAAAAASHGEMATLLEAEHRLSNEVVLLEREIVSLIAEDGPLTLVGQDLISATLKHLESQEQGSTGGPILDEAEIEIIWRRFESSGPPLDPAHGESLRERFHQACRPHETPDDRSGQDGPLDRSTARAAYRRLSMISGDYALGRLAKAREAHRLARNSLNVTKAMIADRRRGGEQRAGAQERLAIAAHRIEQAEGERGARRQHAAALQESLEPKRAELDRLGALARDAAPRFKAAAAARQLAELIDAHMARLADTEHKRFAQAVTKCFRTLSHKDQLARIDIGADGSIALYDSYDRDVTDFRLSAGESQLFAMALIGAVGELVGDRLPLIVDTPLGRLDTLHRRAVLELLGSRTSQTILLTQPEEMTSANLQAIGEYLGGSARLEHHVDRVSGVGISTFAEGLKMAPEPA